MDNRDIQPDQLAEVAQGYLETSNVNPTEELVEMLSKQRHYELNVRLAIDYSSPPTWSLNCE